MLTADPATALAKTRRVLRPGGRLALSVWGATSIAGMTLVEAGTCRPRSRGRLGVWHGERGALRALLDGAGFGSVRTEEVPVRFAFRGLDDYEQWVIDAAGPFAMVVRGSPEMSGRCSGRGSRSVCPLRRRWRVRASGRRPLRGGEVNAAFETAPWRRGLCAPHSS
jgi:SAM-dependent methyltransferase